MKALAQRANALKNNFQDYKKALSILYLQILSERRKKLCESFAKKFVKNESITFHIIDNIMNNYCIPCHW